MFILFCCFLGSQEELFSFWLISGFLANCPVGGDCPQRKPLVTLTPHAPRNEAEQLWGRASYRSQNFGKPLIRVRITLVISLLCLLWSRATTLLLFFFSTRFSTYTCPGIILETANFIRAIILIPPILSSLMTHRIILKSYWSHSWTIRGFCWSEVFCQHFTVFRGNEVG